MEDEKCRYNLVWRSQHACPMCTEKDMKVIKGECGVTGKRPINMIWKEPKQCYGGQDIPDLHYEPCTAVVIDKGRVTLIALVSVWCDHIPQRTCFFRERAAHLSGSAKPRRGRGVTNVLCFCCWQRFWRFDRGPRLHAPPQQTNLPRIQVRSDLAGSSFAR